MLARRAVLSAPLLMLLLAAFAVASGPQPDSSGPFLYIATNGDDANACTLAAPCATLPHAASLATPGTTVFVRGGTYSIGASQTITAIGTAPAPITIRAYQLEVPLFDASAAPLGMYESAVKVLQSEYVTVHGLSVCCSSGRGLTVSESSHVTLSSNHVTETWDRAIGGAGDNITIRNNVVDRVILSNQARTSSGGWSAAIASWALWDLTPSRDWVVEGNEVSRAYGECFLAAQLIGFTYRFNHANGCYSVDMYVDRASDGVIYGNTFEATIPGFERLDTGRNAHGILFASESGDNPISPSNIEVSSNVIGPDVTHGVSWWTDPENTGSSNTYHDLTVTRNRIIGTWSAPVSFEAVGSGAPSPCCNVLSNNVLSGNPDFAEPAAWTVSGNVQWRSQPRTPPTFGTRGAGAPWSYLLAETTGVEFRASRPLD